jgi:hypothetical protein
MNAQLTRSKDGATGKHSPAQQLPRSPPTRSAAAPACRSCALFLPMALQLPGSRSLAPSWFHCLPCPPAPPRLCAAETKIQELAGIVKLLRRGLKEMQTKSSEFIAAACKYEKEVGQQVGGRVGWCRWGWPTDCCCWCCGCFFARGHASGRTAGAGAGVMCIQRQPMPAGLPPLLPAARPHACLPAG